MNRSVFRLQLLLAGGRDPESEKLKRIENCERGDVCEFADAHHFVPSRGLTQPLLFPCWTPDFNHFVPTTSGGPTPGH